MAKQAPSLPAKNETDHGVIWFQLIRPNPSIFAQFLASGYNQITSKVTTEVA